MKATFFQLVWGAVLGAVLATAAAAVECTLAEQHGVLIGRWQIVGVHISLGFLLGCAGAALSLLLDDTPLQSVFVMLGSRTQTFGEAMFRACLPGVGFLMLTLVATVVRDAAASESSEALGHASVFTAFVVTGLMALLWACASWSRGGARGVRDLRVVVALGWSAAIAALVFAVGTGPTDGHGFFGVWGVLHREELDLRPIAYALAPLMAGYTCARLAILRAPKILMLTAFGVASAAIPAWHVSANMSPEQASHIEEGAPYGRIALHLLRKRFDKDRDGSSAKFGGGDCNDRDPRVNPSALETPDNGVDEDCSGEDLPAHAPALPSAATEIAATRASYVPAKNVVFITVDTLRHDLQWTGYAKPNAPRLTALAQRSVWFERAYAMASYTGKSLGPLMAGKYPSQTARDGGHFTNYSASNLMLAERLKAAGVQTFGASTLNYVSNEWGITQGFDAWDLHAIPPGAVDHESGVSSDKLVDVALRQLSNPALQGTRFMAWYHFMDPHRDYVAHKGAPHFGEGEKGVNAQSRARYDSEVWFTDSQIGRLIDELDKRPWGAETAVVITADHGEAFNDHGMNYHGFELWESLVRVPLIIRAPRVLAHKVEARRSQVSLVPTVLDLMGVSYSASELSGDSMLPDLLSKAPAQPSEIYIDMPEGPFNEARRALITGPGAGMKLISRGGAWELYNLDDDAAEANNLGKDRARLKIYVETMQGLRAGLQEITVKPRVIK